MLLAVKTVKSDWCGLIRILLVKSPLVYCLYGAGSCRQRLSGVCSKLVSQLFQSESLIVICSVVNALGRVPVDSVVRLSMVLSNVIVDITIYSARLCSLSRTFKFLPVSPI